MADANGLGRQLERVRSQFVQELDINRLLPRLLVKGVLTVLEEKEILSPSVPQKRVEVLLDILCRKDRPTTVFYELCRSLEECAPNLLTALLLGSHQGLDEENLSVITTKERDALLLENANAQIHEDLVQRDVEQTLKEKDKTLISAESLPEKENILELNSSLSPHTSRLKMRDKLLSVETDQVFEENGPNVAWETYNVSLQKVPTFGFGIAVSGGYDSPHFANGDPSVAISDVLRGGPAEGNLQINDRIVTVNGISLENVDHNMAIRVLRESGSIISLVVRRRILLPAPEAKMSSTPFKITLTKKNKTDEFGLVLGYKVFIREIVRNSLASNESALHEGDTILKINDNPVENFSLVEVKKLIDRSKDKLQLIVKTEGIIDVGNTNDVSIQESISNVGVVPSQLTDNDNVNIFRPNRRSEEDIYVKDPTSRVRRAVPSGAYPKSENTRYDGRYVWDNDPPSWATLPRKTERKMSKKLDDKESLQHDLHDGYYSDQDDGSQGEFVPIHKPGNYVTNHVPLSRSFHDFDPRRVTFHKDKQTGLGLRLAGGNATGMFIASVHPGSVAEREGLMEGDKILFANDIDMAGMIREEAVSFLTNLEGRVSLVVQYRKEEYGRIMTSHEAGDSFYIRTHFKHTASDTETEHSFKVGDIFHVKDTLFRGIGGSWLVVKVSDGLKQKKKGIIPNSKIAEILKSQQKEEGDNFSHRGRGSFFRRKSFSRRSKSLGKDHWEQMIFAGVGTKFPAYERVMYREPGFTRPVVIFGAVSDIARERLLAEFPNKFYSPQTDKSSNQEEKKEKNVVVTLGSIREAVANRKHCLLDITPLSVDRLNYAQYNPIVIFLKADTKQSVKDIRGRWKTTSRSPRKLLEQSEKIEKTHSHVFTGYLKHMGTDAWFPKLYEIVEFQQRQKIWMSEKQPVEDMSDDLMFPMSSRMSCTTGTSSNVDIAQLQSALDISTMGMQQGGKFASVPSVNMLENLPSYSIPTTYKNQRQPSQDLRNSVSDVCHMSPRDDSQVHMEDRYHPSYYSDHMASDFPDSRISINPYTTQAPVEKMHPTVQSGDSLDLDSYKERKEEEDKPLVDSGKQDIAGPGGSQLKRTLGKGGEDGGYTDNTSQLSDSYSSPQNKHDDTKLHEKFGSLQNTGREKSPGYDSYRLTSSTAYQAGGHVDKVKLSDLSSRRRTYNSTSSSRYQTTTNIIPSSHPSGLDTERNLPQTAASPYHSSVQHKPQQQFYRLDRGPSLDSTLPVTARWPDQDFQDTKAYTNKVYMNQFDLQKARQAKLQPEAALGVAEYSSQVGHGRERGREGMQGRIPNLDRPYARPR